MPAPVKMKGKGTSILQSISAVYTAIPAVISIDKSGEESEVYDARTLDSAAGLPKEPTGFVAPPVISLEMFYDAAHASHIAIKTLIRAPTATNFKITYTDTGPLSEVWSVVGVGMDEKVVGNDGVKATVKLTTSGTAS